MVCCAGYHGVDVSAKVYFHAYVHEEHDRQQSSHESSKSVLELVFALFFVFVCTASLK